MALGEDSIDVLHVDDDPSLVDVAVDDPVESGRRLRLGLDVEPRLFALEGRGGHVDEAGVVVDVEHVD